MKIQRQPEKTTVPANQIEPGCVFEMKDGKYYMRVRGAAPEITTLSGACLKTGSMMSIDSRAMVRPVDGEFVEAP